MTTAVMNTPPAGLQAPSLARRMSSLVYEVLVLFGVSLITGTIATVLQKLTGENQDGLSRLIAYGVYGIYFVWFWTRRGQTLPMQTWNIRVVSADGRPLDRRRAIVRYLAASLWVAPPALLAWVAHWTRWQGLAVVGAWMVLYGLLALLHPQRQFWHDAIAGTRLVSTPPRQRAPR